MGPHFSYLRLFAYKYPETPVLEADGAEACLVFLGQFLRAVELDCLDLDRHALGQTDTFQLIAKLAQNV